MQVRASLGLIVYLGLLSRLALDISKALCVCMLASTHAENESNRKHGSGDDLLCPHNFLQSVKILASLPNTAKYAAIPRIFTASSHSSEVLHGEEVFWNLV